VTDPILARVHEIVLRVAGAARTPPGAGPDTPLGGGGFWLDSVDMLDVVLTCEQELGTTFDAAADLGAEGMQSARTLADLIRRRVTT
jgi:acyl carrier protein